MTLFIFNKKDYPRYLGDLLLEHPHWEMGNALPAGWELVHETEFPILEKGQRAIEELIYENNQWIKKFKIETIKEDEIELEKQQLREIRDKKPNLWNTIYGKIHTPLIEEIRAEVAENGGDNI